jgi:hypothetical protein
MRPVVIWEGHGTSGVYQLAEYRAQPAFDPGFPAAAATRLVVIWEGHGTRCVESLES